MFGRGSYATVFTLGILTLLYVLSAPSVIAQVVDVRWRLRQRCNARRDVVARLDAEPAEVIVRYNCRGRVQLSRVPNSLDGYFKLRDLLSRHGLDHDSAICGTVAKIQLNPVVPVESR